MLYELGQFFYFIFQVICGIIIFVAVVGMPVWLLFGMSAYFDSKEKNK